MGAIISSNTLRLEPDGLSYQTGRIQLSAAPTTANTMVFYYKAYVNTMAESILEDGTNYAWNNDAFFGLSFNGSVSANVGGIVGFSNSNQTNVGTSTSQQNWSGYWFGKNSGYTSMVGFTMGYNGGSYNLFSYGHPSSVVYYSTPTWGSIMCMSTRGIGLSAQKYLGIIKIGKNDADTSKVTLSYGCNWEGLSAQDFTSALTSTNTAWSFENASLVETTNFRPNNSNPLLSNTINFPTWVVVKWPSAVVGRNLVITDIKVEYYT
jgi:hypothetical protein